jgi:hypothetical protein
MQSVIPPALLAFTLVALGATPSLADTESQYYANLEAFNTTHASGDMNCQAMIRTASTIALTPQLSSHASVPRYFGTLALDAGLCVDDVRTETPNALPARIPLNFLVLACGRVRPYLKSVALKEASYDSTIKRITRACAGALATPGLRR